MGAVESTPVRAEYERAGVERRSCEIVTAAEPSSPVEAIKTGFATSSKVTDQRTPCWVGRFGKACWPHGDGPITIDLFAGCGGLSLGFRAAGFRIVAAVEKDAIAAKTYRMNFPDEVVIGPEDEDEAGVKSGDGDKASQKISVGDITKTSDKDLLTAAGIERGRLDLIIGGPPCQGYSDIGHRRVDDPRNKLYQHFVRLVGELRPAAYLLENVPGMMKMDGGAILNDLISSLKKLGYSAEASLVNAATYGVPQLRTRLFVAGMRDGRHITLGDGPLSPKEFVTTEDALDGLPHDLTAVPLMPPFELPYDGVPRSVYARMLQRDSPAARNCMPTVHSQDLQKRLKALAAGASDHPTKHRRLDAKLPAWTLRAGSRTRTACRPIHPTEPRVITVREAARLSSFPDEFWLPDLKSTAHMLIGNSVPPLLAYHLAMQIAEQAFAGGDP